MQQVLADVATEIEAARLLVWRAAWMGRNGMPMTGGQGSMSKLKAGDVTMWATTTLMDLVGPYAQTTDCPLEKWFRDAKIYQIFEGTAQVQRLVISRMQRTEYQRRLTEVLEQAPGNAAGRPRGPRGGLTPGVSSGAVIAPLAHVGSGVFEPLQLLPAGACAGRLRGPRPNPGRARAGLCRPPRIACFGLGLALIVAGLVTPVAHLGEELVLAHMAQHLVMADLGALFLVLGLTGPLPPAAAGHPACPRPAGARPPGRRLRALGGGPVRLASARPL